MPRKAIVEETENVEETPLEAVEEIVIEEPSVGFRVKPDNRWNTIQCAGIGFSKSQPVMFNVSNPALAEIRACPMLEEV